MCRDKLCISPIDLGIIVADNMIVKTTNYYDCYYFTGETA